MADPRGEIRLFTTGTDKLIAKLKYIRDELPTAIGASAYLISSEVIEASAEIVPVETGVLKDSRYVDMPDTVSTPGVVSVKLGYGGMARAYAWNQDYGGWLDLHAGYPNHSIGPYYPMMHPPKWAEAVLGGHKVPFAKYHTRADAMARMDQQAGMAHFLETPFFARADAYRQGAIDALKGVIRTAEAM